MQPLLSLNRPEASLDFEVLLRMNGPSGTPVPTTRLLAAAQASGCMGKIDLWVLSTTLAWLTAHQHALAQTRFACVNLSGASLNDERFLDSAYALLEGHLPLLGMLCLEITESVALQDIKNTRKFIDKVRRMGASVALDDFGAGYTSFSYLKEIHADLLKIDGSFVVDMNAHPTHIAIVQAIVRLAKSLDMQVIAEWVEDHATLQALKDMGVDYAQGRIISDALAPERILGVRSAQDFLVQSPPEPLAPAG
jgi:EAL domain-containing protein (putative c-di-GMP-specific phosphodiesterase class I)